MQAILLTTSLLIVAAMLASVTWLSLARVRSETQPVSADRADESP